MSLEKGKNLPWILLPICKEMLAAAFKLLLPGQSMFHIPTRTCFRKMLVTDRTGWLGAGGRRTTWAACDGSLLCLLPGFPGVPAAGISGQTEQQCLAVNLHLDCEVGTQRHVIFQRKSRSSTGYARQPACPLGLMCPHMSWAHRWEIFNILGEMSLNVKLTVVIYLLLLLCCTQVELITTSPCSYLPPVLLWCFTN